MIKTLMLSASLSAALVLFSVPLSAGTVEPGSANKISSLSSRIRTVYPDVHAADRLFAAVHDSAQQAADHAANLESFDSAEPPSWHADNEELSYLKDEVNDMGQRLGRLEAIRGEVAPWQVRTINDLARTLRLMADNANDAIRFEASHHNDLLNPTYQLYLDNLYNQATAVVQSTDRALDYAKVDRQYRDLRHDLGFKAS